MSALRTLQLQSDAMSRAAVELRGPRLNVYARLNQTLDFVEFRPVKISAIASALNLPFRTAADAMAPLVRAGYLEAGHRVARARQYRLLKVEPPRDMQAAS
jgi:hypothetical protein